MELGAHVCAASSARSSASRIAASRTVSETVVSEAISSGSRRFTRRLLSATPLKSAIAVLPPMWLVTHGLMVQLLPGQP
jgi:hypothetical protein